MLRLCVFLFLQVSNLSVRSIVIRNNPIFNENSIILGVANLVAAAFCVVMLVFTGYLVDVATALPFLRWIQWMSLFRYASDALSYNEFTNLTLCSNNMTKTCHIKGETILKDQKIDHATSWDLNRNFVALTVMTLGCFALTFVQLLRFQKKR